MSKLLKYPVPFLLLLIAINILGRDPMVPVSKSIPIIPGANKYSLSGFFLLLSLASYWLIRRNEDS